MNEIKESALGTAHRYEIEVVISRAVLGVELIGTFRVLSTLIAYLVAIHLFVEEDLVSRVLVL